MIREQCIDLAGGSLQFYDDLDEAIVGVGEQYSNPPIVVYDRDKVIAITMKNLDCDEDEAWEYLLSNTFSRWVGELTPMFLSTICPDDEE